jgi:hypothetical protein
MWGRPEEGVLGRIPKALQLAHMEQARLIYWGSGASERDGMEELRYAFEYTMPRAGKLPQFRGLDVYEIRAVLESISFVDVVAQNTREEIENAITMCRERGIHDLFLISSPTHIARCLQEAERYRRLECCNVRIFAAASDTCFAGSIPDDVVIFEPPHRSDRPSHPIHDVVRGIWRIPSERMINFLDELKLLIIKYTR